MKMAFLRVDACEPDACAMHLDSVAIDHTRTNDVLRLGGDCRQQDEQKNPRAMPVKPR